MNTLQRIERTVEDQPGMTFSQLKRKLGVANGVLQYHLQATTKLQQVKGAILTPKTCESCEYRERCDKKCLLTYLNNPRDAAIISRVRKGETHHSIAEALGLDRSTIGHHVRKLRDAGLLGE